MPLNEGQGLRFISPEADRPTCLYRHPSRFIRRNDRLCTYLTVKNICSILTTRYR
jgi:hypothetical protein